MLLLPLLAVACVVAAQLVGAPPLPNQLRVATSGTHTLVVAPDGTVLCQGRNQHRTCGADSSVEFLPKLTPVLGAPKARAVAVADSWTSMVLGEDGRVYVWGKNDFGLLGGTDRGPAYVRQDPTPVATLDRVIDVAASIYGGVALRDDGTVWMWGEDQEGFMASGTLTKSGQNGKPQYTPRRVPGIDSVVQIAAGSKHVLALKSDGTVWAWGANKYSQLGLGDSQGRAVPTKVPPLAGVTRVLADDVMSAAQQSDGSWVAWGRVPSGRPPTDQGDPPVLTPSPLPGLLRDAADFSFGAVVLRDHTVRTWGSNSFGGLGTGAGVDAVAGRSGALVRSLSGIVRVWTGGDRRLALKSDGTLYLWGPSGSPDASVFRVPTVLATFTLATSGTP